MKMHIHTLHSQVKLRRRHEGVLQCHYWCMHAVGECTNQYRGVVLAAEQDLFVSNCWDLAGEKNEPALPSAKEAYLKTLDRIRKVRPLKMRLINRYVVEKQHLACRSRQPRDLQGTDIRASSLQSCGWLAEHAGMPQICASGLLVSKCTPRGMAPHTASSG